MTNEEQEMTEEELEALTTPDNEVTDTPEEEVEEVVVPPVEKVIDHIVDEFPEEEEKEIVMSPVTKLFVDMTLEEIREENPGKIASMVSALLEYNETMKQMTFTDRHTAKHYYLMNRIKVILGMDDKIEQKKLLNVVCKAFVKFDNEGFSNIKLFRFDGSWKWGTDSLDTANVLSTVFSSLSNMDTRTEQLKTLDFARVHEVKGLTQKQTLSLEEYFNN